MSQNKQKYIELEYLLSAYFHQDMNLEYENIEQALKDYVFQNDNGHIILTLNQIEELHKQNYNSKELWETIRKLGCEHFFQDYSNAPEKWLDYVSDTIKKYLVEKLAQKEQNKM